MPGYRKLLFLIFCLVTISHITHADSIPARFSKYQLSYSLGNQRMLTYQPQKKFSFITSLPADLVQFGKMSFRAKSLPAIALIAGTTALLIPYDQDIIKGVRNLSDNIHLRPETDYIEIVKLGDVHVFRLPKNLNTAFYQAGQGFTTMLLAGGLYAQGLIKKDYRSISVAGQLTESFIMMAVITQVLKRATGRESPFMATRSGGAWNPFPSFSDFQQNTSAYDAMPSGHLATMMSALTILIDNYPEKKWIAPVGYIIMGLSAFAMMNTEVHWAGDYPLALGLGYVCGKVVSFRHKKTVTAKAFVP
jgi:hypothetical protein